MSNVPPFPASVMNRRDDGSQPQQQGPPRAVFISSEQSRHDDARRRQRQPQPEEVYIPPRGEFQPGGRPARPVPLMTHMAEPDRGSLPLRPPEPEPMSPEQHRNLAEQLNWQSAWRVREAADRQESARREADYQRYLAEAGRRR
jgi:hypothetical protein